MEFGPQKLELRDLGIGSLGALISGILGSIIILILIFLLGGFINISDGFINNNNGVSERTSIFPIVLSVVTFLATSITIFVTYFFLHFSNPDRYKKNYVIFGQLAFFIFFVYLFFSPVYIYAGLIDYNYIMIVFLIHSIIVMFGASLISEILNNYRYVLVSVYGSFLGLFVSIIITSFIFFSFESSDAKLWSLLFLLPLINFMQTFFKLLFDFIYYHYNRITNQDQIGDIFYRIEIEEKEALREEEEKNNI